MRRENDSQSNLPVGDCLLRGRQRKGGDAEDTVLFSLSHFLWSTNSLETPTANKNKMQ